jgi:hypothetical protein
MGNERQTRVALNMKTQQINEHQDKAAIKMRKEYE